MSEVPDHLIERAAEAAAVADGWDVEGVGGWVEWDDRDKAPYVAAARAALSAVADELRAEGARAERERIAREIKGITARRMDGGCLSPSAIAARVREGGDTEPCVTADCHAPAAYLLALDDAEGLHAYCERCASTIEKARTGVSVSKVTGVRERG